MCRSPLGVGGVMVTMNLDILALQVSDIGLHVVPRDELVPPDHVEVKVFVAVVDDIVIGVLGNRGDVTYFKWILSVTHHQSSCAFKGNGDFLVDMGSEEHRGG